MDACQKVDSIWNKCLKYQAETYLLISHTRKFQIPCCFFLSKIVYVIFDIQSPKNKQICFLSRISLIYVLITSKDFVYSLTLETIQIHFLISIHEIRLNHHMFILVLLHTRIATYVLYPRNKWKQISTYLPVIYGIMYSAISF